MFHHSRLGLVLATFVFWLLGFISWGRKGQKREESGTRTEGYRLRNQHILYILYIYIYIFLHARIRKKIRISDFCFIRNYLGRLNYILEIYIYIY
jgi:hypothetical protein